MDLKALRKYKLKMTEDEFSETMGMTLSRLKELEEGRGEIGLKEIQEISTKTGMDFNSIMGYEKPEIKALDVNYTWEKADITKKGLVEYIRGILENKDIYIAQESKNDYLAGLQKTVEEHLVKPYIFIVGRSDTGKSTLINKLIGMEKMPASWTPTTSVAVYLKHVNDRPDFIKENTWVFTDSLDGEKMWDVKRLHDEKYCKKWKIAAGEADILRKFGTRQGDSRENAGSAVIFIDTPILQNCDIVDLPGYGTDEEKDNEITKNIVGEGERKRDGILIYLSQANGFMRREDIKYLTENIKILPAWEKRATNKLSPLANLFVVASQAHSVSNGNVRELKNILETGCKNLCKSLSSGYWDERGEKTGYRITDIDVQRRFFTYTTDIPSLCKDFEDNLKNIIEQLPDIIYKEAKNKIETYVNKRRPHLSNELKKYEGMIEDHEKYIRLLKEIEAHELDRRRDNEKSQKKILGLIDELCSESISEFREYCSSIINTDALTRKIEDSGIKNKKSDVECFANKLGDEIQERCIKILKINVEFLSDEVKEYISQFEKRIKISFDTLSIDTDFDAGYAFASALSKMGLIGGLGAYVAGEAAFLFGSMAFCTGLGGQIAVGASLLGPVGITAGLALAAGMGLVKLFGGGWEKNVSEKIVKQFEKNDIINKYMDVINKYWDDTREAFDKSAKMLDKDWDNYVESLKNEINNYDEDKTYSTIVGLKKIDSLFDEILSNREAEK